MKKFLLKPLFVLFFTLLTTLAGAVDARYFHPGEFGRVEAVMFAHPINVPFELIVEISKDVKAIIIVENERRLNMIRARLTNDGANMNNVEFLQFPTDRYWTRDYGPWVVFNKTDMTRRIVGYTYNRNRPLDNMVGERYANSIGIPFVRMPVYHTGGNYMTDGYGTAMSTTLLLKENTRYTEETILQPFAENMGMNRYLLYEDINGEYIEHIDCWAKLVSPDTVIMRQLPRDSRLYDLAESTAQSIASTPSAYGTNYRVIRINTSRNEPYSNSLIVNNKVFVPIKGTPNDEAALATYRNAMPGYEVFGFDGQWLSTDALHCRTKEIPDSGLLHIEYTPANGIVRTADSINIKFTVYPFSRTDVINDKTGVYWKAANSTQWSFVKATPEADRVYSVAIPLNGNNPIQYYIHAEDRSGRAENIPFIGAPMAFTYRP